VSAGRASGGGAARQVTERRGRDSTGLIITERLIEPLGVINTAAESLPLLSMCAVGACAVKFEAELRL